MNLPQTRRYDEREPPCDLCREPLPCREAFGRWLCDACREALRLDWLEREHGR